MDSLDMFFNNRGLLHIGQQILSGLELNDLWSCRQVAKDWKNLADVELQKVRVKQLSLFEKWMQEEGDEFDKYWGSWFSVTNHFNLERNVRDLAAFVTLLERYTVESRKRMRDRKNVLYYFKSPLHFAIEEDDLETVKLLLPSCQNIEEEQKNVERIDEEFGKAQLRLLQSALRGQSSFEMFKLILDNADWLGIDVNETFPNGYYKSNVLRKAVTSQKLECIKYILENNDKFGFNHKIRHDDDRDDDDDVELFDLPFGKACAIGSLAMVDLFLSHYDKILMDDPDCDSGFVRACRQEGNVEIVQRLIEFYDEKGMNLNVKDVDGDTGLIAACYEGHLDIVKVIIEASKTKNIDVHATNEFGFSALEMARKEGNEDIVEFLTEQLSALGKADPKKKNKKSKKKKLYYL